MEPVEVEIEIIEVDTKSVACDGGGGALGHPKVWVALDASGHGTCLYCGRRFVLKSASASAAIGAGPPPVQPHA